MLTIYFKSEVPALGDSIRSIDTADEIERAAQRAATLAMPGKGVRR